MKYKFYKLKELEKLPEDVNNEFEKIAKEKNSENLLKTLIDIREKKIYTGNKPGAMFMNMRTGDILCFIEAHSGVIKEIRINSIIAKPGDIDQRIRETSLMDAYKNFWSDDLTKAVLTQTIRNQRVDWEIPEEIKQKRRKKWDVKEKKDESPKENKLKEVVK